MARAWWRSTLVLMDSFEPFSFGEIRISFVEGLTQPSYLSWVLLIRLWTWVFDIESLQSSKSIFRCIESFGPFDLLIIESNLRRNGRSLGLVKWPLISYPWNVIVLSLLHCFYSFDTQGQHMGQNHNHQIGFAYLCRRDPVIRRKLPPLRPSHGYPV